MTFPCPGRPKAVLLSQAAIAFRSINASRSMSLKRNVLLQLLRLEVLLKPFLKRLLQLYTSLSLGELLH